MSTPLDKLSAEWRTDESKLCDGFCPDDDAAIMANDCADQLDAALADMWQPIETAPKDGTSHIRGLWVNVKNAPKEFQRFIGGISDNGGFVDPDYEDDFGWAADDYTHWMPLHKPPKEQE